MSPDGGTARHEAFKMLCPYGRTRWNRVRGTTLKLGIVASPALPTTLVGIE